jgi:hypothetical protein
LQHISEGRVYVTDSFLIKQALDDDSTILSQVCQSIVKVCRKDALQADHMLNTDRQLGCEGYSWFHEDEKSLIASFPWYDLPSVRWANDLLFAAMDLPGVLDRRTPVAEQWCAADLFISQACGLDLIRKDLPIDPVLTPVFDLDAPAGEYFSYLVRAEKECSSSVRSVGAVNGPSSHSGLVALLEMCAPDRIIVTGSHQESLRAVAQGLVEYAAIDAVIWHILARDNPDDLKGLVVVDRSDPAPAPPYVCRSAGLRHGTGPNTSPISSRGAKALMRAILAPDMHPARDALLIVGVKTVRRSAYEPVFKRYRNVLTRVPEALRLDGVLPSGQL